MQLSAQGIGNTLVDMAAQDPDTKFSIAELLSSFAGGAISGGVLGGTAAAVGIANRSKAEKAADKEPFEIKPSAQMQENGVPDEDIGRAIAASEAKINEPIASVGNVEYNKNVTIAHPSLRHYSERIKNGEVISADEIETLPEIKAAKKRAAFNKSTIEEYPPGVSEGRDAIRNKVLDFLFSDENGTAVFENGKLKSENGKGVYTGTVKQERVEDIVIGSPAAGKSTVFADRLSNEHGARILDSDIVKKELPEFDNGYGASRVQAESAYIVEELSMEIAIFNGDNIVLPKIGKSADSLLDLAQVLKENGYTVNLYYNELPTEKAISRAFGRFITEGRYLPIDYLKSVKAEDIENTYKQLKESGLIDYYEWKSNDVPYGYEPITKDSGRFGIGSNRQKIDRGTAESGSNELYTGASPEIGRTQSKGTGITDTSLGVSISLQKNPCSLKVREY